MQTIAQDAQTAQTMTIGQPYRLALADTIAQARATLPQALHSRLDRAAAIVHAGGVTLHNDGAASVACQSQPGKFYRVAAGECQCEDFNTRRPNVSANTSWPATFRSAPCRWRASGWRTMAPLSRRQHR